MHRDTKCSSPTRINSLDPFTRCTWTTLYYRYRCVLKVWPRARRDACAHVLSFTFTTRPNAPPVLTLLSQRVTLKSIERFAAKFISFVRVATYRHVRLADDDFCDNGCKRARSTKIRIRGSTYSSRDVINDRETRSFCDSISQEKWKPAYANNKHRARLRNVNANTLSSAYKKRNDAFLEHVF